MTHHRITSLLMTPVIALAALLPLQAIGDAPAEGTAVPEASLKQTES